jgi:hypothetical protein
MATIITPQQQAPKKLSVFLGLNEDIDGEIGLKLGEATTMSNFRVTPNFKIKQREGYKEVIKLDAAIDGMILFQGKLIVASNGLIYEFNEGEF